ncbi:tetratricopeptide repeat protein [Ramlibacter albus]|uniref:C-type cytochrome biogenesis protein CcmI n=1 Tax=Ramlibacter albus TaxID=2079448 RepID=A0A923S1N0_9BURK|nr:c-type cytochrome biogenesis protein CcmI [Ramlibacter albus]MBC5764465.1 c-type cytochrome biogenesis protein CcmI [Ramlibacter albus]
MTAFLLTAAALALATMFLTLRPLVFARGFARPTKTLLGGALAIPVAASLMYLGLGNPSALGEHAAQDPQQAEVEKMVADFAAKMAANPGDAKGWALLARSYKVMGRAADAAQAYEKAMPAIKDDAGELANYADSAGSVAGGNLQGKPAQLIEQALKVDPNHPMALWLSGTVSLQRKDYDRAVATWEKLQKLLPADGDDAREIRGALADARARAGKPALPVEAPVQTAAAAAPSGSSVSGTVELAASVKANARPDDIVMIIARPIGTRMPVAVMRARVAELPLKFTLDDSLAMSPQARISGVAEVEVEARVSKTGQAKAEAGDLVSAVQTVKVGASGLKVAVDTVR